MRKNLLLWIFVVISIGCNPYQDEIDKAKREAEEAKSALKDEQDAVKRLYDED